MKTRCEKKNLQSAIDIAGKAIAARSPLPILTNFLIKGEGGNLKIAGTDLEIAIECNIGAEILEEGSFAVSGRVFSDIVSQLPEGSVEIEASEERMEIKKDGARFVIMTLSGEEFPMISQIVESFGFSISERKLKNMIRDVIFATASQEESKATMTGVLFLFKERKMSLIATDGRRMAKIDEDSGTLFEKEVGVIVPGKALHEVMRLLKDTEEELRVSVGEGKVSFDLGSVRVMSRMLEGQFPDFRKVIPLERTMRLKIDRNKFLGSIRRALVFAQDKQSPRLVKFHIFQDRIVVRANTADLGSAYEEVPLESEGGEMEISFNGVYLVDVLSNLSNPDVYLDLKGPYNQGVVRPADQDNYVYVLMPVRVKDEVERDVQEAVGRAGNGE